MSPEKNFLDAVERCATDLGQNPEVRNILASLREGQFDHREAVWRVWETAKGDPEMSAELEALLLDAFQLTPETTALVHSPTRQSMLEAWGFSDEDLLYQPFPDRPHYQMLHPLFMGAILEQLQFDGDIPELRTGDLPSGGFPAVPVKTTARDPVVIGAMLKAASEHVAEELAAAQAARSENVAALTETLGKNDHVTAIVRQQTSIGVGVPGYRPGHRAEPREVAVPSGMELSQLTFGERQDLAHRTLTSTQGRKSATPVIAQTILSQLHEQGLTAVLLGDGKDEICSAEWLTLIDGSQRENNPNFNFISVAAKALCAKLLRGIEGKASRFTRLFLFVKPIGAISERQVGWRATLYECQP